MKKSTSTRDRVSSLMGAAADIIQPAGDYGKEGKKHTEGIREIS